MFKILINGLLGVIQSIINIVLLPINTLINNLFPNQFINAINNFTNLLNNYVGGGISWFSYLLPPIFRSLVILSFTFIIGYYTFVWTYAGIVKIWNVIQKIKFW